MRFFAQPVEAAPLTKAQQRHIGGFLIPRRVPSGFRVFGSRQLALAPRGILSKVASSPLAKRQLYWAKVERGDSELMGNSVTKVCSLTPACCHSSHPMEQQTWLGSVLSQSSKKKKTRKGMKLDF